MKNVRGTTTQTSTAVNSPFWNWNSSRFETVHFEDTNSVVMLGKTLIVVFGLISASFGGRIRSNDYCVHEGKRYEHGQQFSLESCSYVCTCEASAGTEAFLRCERLCPRYYDYTCDKGMSATFTEEPAGPEELNCMCSYYTCVPDLKVSAGYLSYGGDGDELIELEPIPIDFER